MDYRITCFVLHFLSLNMEFVFGGDPECTLIGDLFLQYKNNKPKIEIVDVEVTRQPGHVSVRQVLQKIRPAWKMENLDCFTLDTPYVNKYDECSESTLDEEPVLVKIFEKQQDLVNTLQQETAIYKALNEQGYAPPILAVFRNGYVLDKPTGRTVSEVNWKDPWLYESIATSMALIKKTKLPANFPKETRMWKTIEEFISRIPDKYSDELTQKRFTTELPEGFRSREDIKKEYEVLKKHLLSLNASTGFCHNDIFSSTMYYDKKSKTTTFINYAIAGYNYEAYEIATHWFEYAGVYKVDFKNVPEDDFMKKFLKKYLEVKRGIQSSEKECTAGKYSEKELSTLLNHSHKFMLASDFYWGTFCLAQSADPKTEDDYIMYATKRFDHYKKYKDDFFALRG